MCCRPHVAMVHRLRRADRPDVRLQSQARVVRGVRFVELDASRRVTRHAVDQVNNNLTAQLMWCATHVEPVWVHNDGSFECPHTTVVGWDSDGAHDIVAPPWENPAVPTGTRWPDA